MRRCSGSLLLLVAGRLLLHQLLRSFALVELKATHMFAIGALSQIRLQLSLSLGCLMELMLLGAISLT